MRVVVLHHLPPPPSVHPPQSQDQASSNLLWSRHSSTVVTPHQRPGSSPSCRPDPDGHDDSSVIYYGGSCLAYGCGGSCLTYGGSFPCYGRLGLYFGSCGLFSIHPPYPFHGGQFGWPAYRNVLPFVFQHHGVPLAPEGVLDIAASMASTLGDPALLLSSLPPTNIPPLPPSDLTVSVSGYFTGPRDDPPASFHGGLRGFVPAFHGGIPPATLAPTIIPLAPLVVPLVAPTMTVPPVAAPVVVPGVASPPTVLSHFLA